MDHYGEHQLGNPFSQLKLLHQTRSIDDYIEAFKVLMAQVPPLSEEQYMGFFSGGLREDIRMEVLTFEPPNRHCLIFVARLIERKLDRTPFVYGARKLQPNRRPFPSGAQIGTPFLREVSFITQWACAFGPVCR